MKQVTPPRTGSVKGHRLEAFSKRCSFCHDKKDDLEVCYSLDTGDKLGQMQIRAAKRLHLIPSSFEGQNSATSYVLCSSCHHLMSYQGAAPPRIFFVPCRETCAFLLETLMKDKDTTVDEIMDRLEHDHKTAKRQKALDFAEYFELAISGRSGNAKKVSTSRFPKDPFHYRPARKMQNVAWKYGAKLESIRFFEFPEETNVGNGSISLLPDKFGRIRENNGSISRLFWRLPGVSVGALLMLPLRELEIIPHRYFTPELVELCYYLSQTYRNATDSDSDNNSDDDDDDDKGGRGRSKVGGGGGKRKRDDGPEKASKKARKEPPQRGGAGEKGRGGGSRKRKRDACQKPTQRSERLRKRGGCGTGSSEKLAPKPIQDHRQTYSGTFTFGPKWTASMIISKQYGVSHPAPWEQPKDSQLLVLRRPQKLRPANLAPHFPTVTGQSHQHRRV